MYDLIIKNEKIIDNSGSPSMLTDIAVRDAIYTGEKVEKRC